MELSLKFRGDLAIYIVLKSSDLNAAVEMLTSILANGLLFS